MAADFGVWFSSNELPSLDVWEQAAAQLGLRLRIMPVDLRTHSGVLPAAFDADDYNTGFEFTITADWGRPQELSELMQTRNVFAHFRCFSREWPAAVWAAVSFAKASDGLFQDPLGNTFSTFEEALAYAKIESQPESAKLQAERAAKVKSRQAETEAVLREGGKANMRKIEVGEACPNCGFCYGWNGAHCTHCRFQKVIVGES